MRRDSRTRRRPSGTARSGTRRSPTRSAHGAFAPRCGSARGRTCSRRSRRCRPPSRRRRRGATGRRVRSSATGRAADAAPIFTGLAGEVHFYGMLAAEAIGKRQELASAPIEPDADALAAFGATDGVRRAVKLARLDMRPESQREWLYVVRGRPDESLLLAAEYARREGLYDRAINTAERTSARHDYGLRYLMPFREQFAAAAQDNAVDVALLFGIARQESRFAADIVSSAGAVGLMQLMPPTAQWVAKQLNRADYRPSQISDAGLNTQFGAYYFKYWLEKLDRMQALAAAAYNAGPGRAQAWRAATPLEGAVWVETIPFNETRDYVKKVLANAMIYARSLDQDNVPLVTRLGTVQPRGERQRRGDRGHELLTRESRDHGRAEDPRPGWRRVRRPPRRRPHWSRIRLRRRRADAAAGQGAASLRAADGECRVGRCRRPGRAREPRAGRVGGRQSRGHPERDRRADLPEGARRLHARRHRGVPGGRRAPAAPHERAQRRSGRAEPVSSQQGRSRGGGEVLGPRLDDLPAVGDLRPRGRLSQPVRAAPARRAGDGARGGGRTVPARVRRRCRRMPCARAQHARRDGRQDVPAVRSAGSTRCASSCASPAR